VNIDFKERLREMLGAVVENIDGLASDDDLFKLGILDSVMLIQLVHKIEDAFSISVEDRELSPDYFLSIDRMNLYLQHKLGRSSN
jgi:acyl carrier protein